MQQLRLESVVVKGELSSDSGLTISAVRTRFTASTANKGARFNVGTWDSHNVVKSNLFALLHGFQVKGLGEIVQMEPDVRTLQARRAQRFIFKGDDGDHDGFTHIVVVSSFCWGGGCGCVASPFFLFCPPPPCFHVTLPVSGSAGLACRGARKEPKAGRARAQGQTKLEAAPSSPLLLP